MWIAIGTCLVAFLVIVVLIIYGVSQHPKVQAAARSAVQGGYDYLGNYVYGPTPGVPAPSMPSYAPPPPPMSTGPFV